MHYIILTKLEYPTSISIKVKGLTPYETQMLSEKFKERNVKFTNVESNYMEIDLAGHEMLNILARDFGYRVAGMAMAMELSSLGGRSFQIEKVVWTLEKHF